MNIVCMPSDAFSSYPEYEAFCVTSTQFSFTIQACGCWERQSTPLHVSSRHVALFRVFMEYAEEEIKEIGDTGMKKEISVLHTLSNPS